MTSQDRFVSERIRPLCEKLRDLDYEIQSAMVEWYAGQNSAIGNGADEYDGRDGVDALTGAQVTSAVVQLAAVQSLMAGGGVRECVSRPCVRAFRVQ